MARRVKTPWCRVDLNTLSQRRIRMAGPLAGPVYLYATLALMDASESPRGHLDAWELDPEVIADALGMTDDHDRDRIADAKSRLIALEVIAVDGDGYTIPGWEERLPDPRDARSTSTERKRARSTLDDPGSPRKAQEDPAKPRAARCDPATGRDVTIHDGTNPPLTPPSGVGQARPIPNEPLAKTDLARLEAQALDCKPPGRGRGMMLSAGEVAKLGELLEAHGYAAVSKALSACVGYSAPVAGAAKELTVPRRNGGQRRPSAAGINEAHAAASRGARDGGQQGGLPL